MYKFSQSKWVQGAEYPNLFYKSFKDHFLFKKTKDPFLMVKDRPNSFKLKNKYGIICNKTV